jgi:HK97 family phage prohead protease
MPAMKRKEFESIELKLYDPTPEAPHGSFSTYASTFNNFDKVKEAVQPGAFTKSLPKFMKKGFVAVGHNWDVLPAAYPVKAEQDSKGLKITSNFHSTQHGQDARIVLKERMDAGLEVMTSIGYRVVDSEQTKDGKLLKELDLYEFSLVNVPANDEAQVFSVKNVNKDDVETDLTEFKNFFGDTTVSKQFDFLRTANEMFLGRLKAIKELRVKQSRTFSAINISRISEIRGWANGVLTLLNQMDKDEIAEAMEEAAEGETDYSADLATDLAEIAQIRQFANQVLIFCNELEIEEAMEAANEAAEMVEETAEGEMGKNLKPAAVEIKNLEESQIVEQKQLTAAEQEAETLSEKSQPGETPGADEDEARKAFMNLKAKILLEATMLDD